VHSISRCATCRFCDCSVVCPALGWIPSKGNFICVDLGQVAAPVFQGLLREGVIVRPVANYGMPNHLRITVGLPAENSRFLEALAKVLARG
jgi:histidinol-phosphate aminotransferase